MERRPLNDSEIFNPEVRIGRLNGLRDYLGLTAINASSVISEVDPSLPTIGIEIEMNWIEAFTDMQARWLHSSDRPKDYDKQSDTYKEFSRQYNRNNRRLRPKLETIASVIPRVGFDAYWEFSFHPSYHVGVIEAELSTLYEANILSEGIPYATHMTIADIPSRRDAYTLLCELELQGGSSPERIAAAIKTQKGAWSVKGDGGLRLRTSDELKGESTSAYEFRTLFTSSASQMTRLMRGGQSWAAESILETAEWQTKRETIEKWLTANGLPLSSWESPSINPTPWLHYSQLLFDAVK